MIRSTLALIGIGGIGYALYNYFNKQLALALDWDFKIKKVKVKNINEQGAKLDLTVSVLNKSSFSILVKNYNVDIIYEGVVVGKAETDREFLVQGDTWFDVPVEADIQFDTGKTILDELGVALLKTEPILVDVKGDMNVEFNKIKKEVIFNVKDVVVSENLAKDIGVDRIGGKITDFFEDLGIRF